MICDLCNKRQAIFFIEQNSKTGNRKLNFCAECIQKRGISTDPKELSKSLNSLFSEVYDQKKSEDFLCPVCGQKLSFIKMTGITGCPECYEIFKTHIIEYMKNESIFGQYTGDMPKRLIGFRSPLTDRVEVQKKLEEAIQNEDYEKAAFYRDYLHAIENKPVSDANE